MFNSGLSVFIKELLPLLLNEFKGMTQGAHSFLCISVRINDCGLRPSVLEQDRSETKNWSWSCRSGVVL